LFFSLLSIFFFFFFFSFYNLIMIYLIWVSLGLSFIGSFNFLYLYLNNFAKNEKFSSIISLSTYSTFVSRMTTTSPLPLFKLKNHSISPASNSVSILWAFCFLIYIGNDNKIRYRIFSISLYVICYSNLIKIYFLFLVVTAMVILFMTEIFHLSLLPASYEKSYITVFTGHKFIFLFLK